MVKIHYCRLQDMGKAPQIYSPNRRLIVVISPDGTLSSPAGSGVGQENGPFERVRRPPELLGTGLCNASSPNI